MIHANTYKIYVHMHAFDLESALGTMTKRSFCSTLLRFLACKLCELYDLNKIKIVLFLLDK